MGPKFKKFENKYTENIGHTFSFKVFHKIWKNM